MQLTHLGVTRNKIVVLGGKQTMVNVLFYHTGPDENLMEFNPNLKNGRSTTVASQQMGERDRLGRRTVKSGQPRMLAMLRVVTP